MPSMVKSSMMSSSSISTSSASSSMVGVCSVVSSTIEVCSMTGVSLVERVVSAMNVPQFCCWSSSTLCFKHTIGWMEMQVQANQGIGVEEYDYKSPFSLAQTAICAREVNPNFDKTFLTW